AFSTVASSGQALGRTELLARGIYEALITTAAGLSVAIPVLIGYHWINAKITRLVGEMDLMTVDFVEDYAELGPNGSGAQPTSEPGKLRITAEEEGGDTDVEPADEPEDETVATAS
ncbi:MAG: MotA/TolQ/ExbB proton channel family protein, partial [Planctomycetota bacterium]